MFPLNAMQSVIVLIIAFCAGGAPVIYCNLRKPFQCCNCGAETAGPHVPQAGARLVFAGLLSHLHRGRARGRGSRGATEIDDNNP
jgi:hypothetical protein